MGSAIQRQWQRWASRLALDSRHSAGKRTRYTRESVKTILRPFAWPPRKSLLRTASPKSAQRWPRLVQKNWRLRLAAVFAIAKRDDPALLPLITVALDDKSGAVRYEAAATVLRLSRKVVTQ